MFQHYIELFKVIEYKDGEIYKTESLGHMWVTDEYKNNPPVDFICAAPSDDFSKSNSCIKRG